MANSSKRQRRLWDTYTFPGFRPRPTVRGVFGEPKARIITLARRAKKRSAGAAGGFIGALVLSQVLVGLAWAQPAANALPAGGQVVQGAASLAQSGSQLSIQQSSQRAAINWQSFDIGNAAKVNVVQPNAQAVLLNRVVGQSPSQIFGKLQANGHVILVNPNGVLFGAGARDDGQVRGDRDLLPMHRDHQGRADWTDCGRPNFLHLERPTDRGQRRWLRFFGCA